MKKLIVFCIALIIFVSVGMICLYAENENKTAKIENIQTEIRVIISEKGKEQKVYNYTFDTTNNKIVNFNKNKFLIIFSEIRIISYS